MSEVIFGNGIEDLSLFNITTNIYYDIRDCFSLIKVFRYIFTRSQINYIFSLSLANNNFYLRYIATEFQYKKYFKDKIEIGPYINLTLIKVSKQLKTSKSIDFQFILTSRETDISAVAEQFGVD